MCSQGDCLSRPIPHVPGGLGLLGLTQAKVWQVSWNVMPPHQPHAATSLKSSGFNPQVPVCTAPQGLALVTAQLKSPKREEPQKRLFYLTQRVLG